MPISQIVTNSIAPSQTLTTPIIATTMGVGGATPAGSGSGITFPAAQSASSDVNTLDDYEEGSWTPTLVRSVTNPTVSYTFQNGTYVKVGRLVHVTFRCIWSTLTGGSGGWGISSLPFPADSNAAMYPNWIVGDSSSVIYPSASATYATLEIYSGSSTGYFIANGSNYASALITNVQNNGYVYISGTYLTS